MTAMIDLRDQTFGRLTVVDDSGEREGSHIIWLCDCNCGTIDVKTTGKRLRSGKTKSCGCLRREATRARRTIDVTGVEFGYARFVRDTGQRRGGNHAENGSIVWECECFGGSRHGFPRCKSTFVATRGDVYDSGQVSMPRGVGTSASCHPCAAHSTLAHLFQDSPSTLLFVHRTSAVFV